VSDWTTTDAIRPVDCIDKVTLLKFMMAPHSLLEYRHAKLVFDTKVPVDEPGWPFYANEAQEIADARLGYIWEAAAFHCLNVDRGNKRSARPRLTLETYCAVGPIVGCSEFVLDVAAEMFELYPSPYRGHNRPKKTSWIQEKDGFGGPTRTLTALDFAAHYLGRSDSIILADVCSPTDLTCVAAVDIDNHDAGRQGGQSATESLLERLALVESALETQVAFLASSPRGLWAFWRINGLFGANDVKYRVRDAILSTGCRVAKGWIEPLSPFRLPLGNGSRELDRTTLAPVHNLAWDSKGKEIHDMVECLAPDEFFHFLLKRNVPAIPAEFFQRRSEESRTPERERRAAFKSATTAFVESATSSPDQNYQISYADIARAEEYLRSGLTDYCQRNDALLLLNRYFQMRLHQTPEEAAEALWTWISDKHNGYSKDFDEAPEQVRQQCYSMAMNLANKLARGQFKQFVASSDPFDRLLEVCRHIPTAITESEVRAILSAQLPKQRGFRNLDADRLLSRFINMAGRTEPTRTVTIGERQYRLFSVVASAHFIEVVVPERAWRAVREHLYMCKPPVDTILLKPDCSAAGTNTYQLMLGFETSGQT